ncbi:MAG TPA: carbohydrate kinase family protein [Alloacidobacterium sp.]|nr:carbohydrate kinase family protein [Alloacidobacterium sp.]
MFDITIAGEINLDLILYGLPQQMPVERELLASGFEATLGSSSAILAHNLAVLGSRVGFITRVGPDELGRVALERLKDSGANLERVIFDAKTPTGVTVLLPHGKERHIFTYLGTIQELTIADLDLDYLKASRHFHLSSLFLQRKLAPDVPELFRELKRAGLTLSLDTNDDPDDTWSGALDEVLDLIDVLLPNETELCRIAHKDTTEKALDALASRVPCVAVKCGARGSFVLSGGKRFEAPPVNVTPVDTIGAGDSYNAGFLSAWVRGLPLETCARAGNITGALSTLRSGGTEAFRDRELVAAFLQENQFPLVVSEAGAR